MTITSSLFEAFLKCPVKCWLRAANEPPAGDIYAEWVKTQNESYRVAETNRLVAGLPPPERAVSPPADSLKSAKWRIASDVLVQAAASARGGQNEEVRRSAPRSRETGVDAASGSVASGPPVTGSVRGPPDSTPESPSAHLGTAPQPAVSSPGCLLQTCLHLVERVPAQGRGKAAQFIPIRFTFFNKLTKEDKLLLAYDALALGQALGRDITVAKIIHGDHHATLKVKTSALVGEVRKRLEKAAALLSSSAPPDMVLNRQCAECEFRDGCRQKAIEKDDLSLLAGMSENERRKYHSKGIFTVTQLSYTFRPRRRPKRLRDKREKYHHALKALAIREKKIHIVGSPELKIEGTPVYLDVEGLPDRDFSYLIGVRIGNRDAAVQHSLWADTVEEEVTIWWDFLSVLETVQKPVLIHYGSYEQAFLKDMSARYKKPQEDSIAANALKDSVNLISFLFAQFYFPTNTNSLKDIATWLGCAWPEKSQSGLHSIIYRHEWENSRSEAARQLLIEYNAADCAALGRLLTKLFRVLQRGETTGRSDVVHTHTLKSDVLYRFGKVEYAIPDFEYINNAAYWDYQREKVQIRTAGNTRTPKRSPARAKSSRPILHRTTEAPVATACPRCSGKQRKCYSVSRVVQDLKFTRNGLRRTAVKYIHVAFHAFPVNFFQSVSWWGGEPWQATVGEFRRFDPWRFCRHGPWDFLQAVSAEF